MIIKKNNFKKFLMALELSSEGTNKRLFKPDAYIDTPGFYFEEKEDYDNDIIYFIEQVAGINLLIKLEDWYADNKSKADTFAKRVLSKHK